MTLGTREVMQGTRENAQGTCMHWDNAVNEQVSVMAGGAGVCDGWWVHVFV
jgi:hypothetical protein